MVFQFAFINRAAGFSSSLSEVCGVQVKSVVYK
jgi:hypothetical protein